MPEIPIAALSFVPWPAQYIALAAVIFIVACLVTYTLLHLYFQRLIEKKQERWRAVCDLLISSAIFFDEEEAFREKQFRLAIARGKKFIRNRRFRSLLLRETVNAKKNISGKASENLKDLYVQLGLGKQAIRRLHSRKWYVKAKALQELSLLEVEEALPQIYRCTNDVNEQVRMEAQAALVQLKGFEGLGFLDAISYPISRWQQIKLLQLLSNRPPLEVGMDSWLRSANSSVVVFTLKLARNYQRFDLYAGIVACLDHEDPLVRLEAIACLKEIYTEETSDELIGRFLSQKTEHRIAMLHTLRTIASEKDLLFLEDVLQDENNEIKVQAARALARCGAGGLQLLETSAAGSHTLTEIFLHVKGEMAA